MEIFKHRDLTIIKGEFDYIVIGCDSCGGIGEKESDAVFAPFEAVGKYTLRVALLEVLSLNCEIVGVSNTLCCEMKDFGERIIESIRQELKEANILQIALTGSTEENFQTKMTGVGITVIGRCKKLKISKIEKGDVVFLMGTPKVGAEVLEDKYIPTYSEIYEFIKDFRVKEVIPIGSKGILYEAFQIGEKYNLTFYQNEHNIDIKKSAGPASCVIIIISSNYCADFEGKCKKEIFTKVGIYS